MLFIMYPVFSKYNIVIWPMPSGGGKVSMLTHTYPYKPLKKIKVTICNQQADRQLYVWPDVWSGDVQV